MDEVGGSERLTPWGVPFPPAGVIAFAVLGLVEWQIRTRWGVPLWSLSAAVLVGSALTIQGALALALAQKAPHPLRPLTLTSVGVAVLFTVLVPLSDTPSDRWLLLLWLVPASTFAAEKVWPHLPDDSLLRIGSCLLALIIGYQVLFIWHAHTRRDQASSFRNQIAQICTTTASSSTTASTAWVAANQAMITQLAALTAPDKRSFELTAYLINALRNSENAYYAHDPVTQGQWQQLARQIAGELGFGPSCGVF